MEVHRRCLVLSKGTSGKPTSVWQPLMGLIDEVDGRLTSWNELIEEKPLSLSALLTLTGLLALQVGFFFSSCFEDGAASAIVSSSSVVLLLLEFQEVVSGDLLVRGRVACKLAFISGVLAKHELPELP